MLLHVAGKERERDITVNAKRRKDWTAEQHGQAWGCQKSHLLGTSPLLITVLLLSTPNSGDCLLEKVRGRTWGNIWHIQMWLSHRGVAEQLERGDRWRDWCQAQAQRDRGQFSGSSCCHLGPMNKHMSGTTWHWCLTSKHCPGTGEGGVLGTGSGSSVWTSISREQHLQRWVPCRHS